MSSINSTRITVVEKPHHKPTGKCYTRAKYRQGRDDSSVKVFTVSQESYFLLVRNVPSVGVHSELQALCEKFGRVESCQFVDYPNPSFTETFLVKYTKLQEARTAKKQLDERSFFGAILQVCFAPELETLTMTRTKLKERKLMVAARLRHINNPVVFNKETIQTGQKYQTIYKPTKIVNPIPDSANIHPVEPNSWPVPETLTYIWAGQEYTVPVDSSNNHQNLMKNCRSTRSGAPVRSATSFKPRQVAARDTISDKPSSLSYEDTRKRVRAKLDAVKCTNSNVNIIHRKRMKPDT